MSPRGWEEFVQFNPNGRMDFDARRIRWIEFLILAENTPFDLWFDDLSFLRR